jgi:hypothetical protein
MDQNNNLLNEENINLSDENQEVEFDEYGMPIEEENEDEMLEIRRILSEKTFNSDYNIEIEKKEKNKTKNNKKKVMSLNDLNNLLNKEIPSNKKFISKRTLDRKKPEIKSFIRNFNPKLVPYFNSEEYLNKLNSFKNIDMQDFPKL